MGEATAQVPKKGRSLAELAQTRPRPSRIGGFYQWDEERCRGIFAMPKLDRPKILAIIEKTYFLDPICVQVNLNVHDKAVRVIRAWTTVRHEGWEFLVAGKVFISWPKKVSLNKGAFHINCLVGKEGRDDETTFGTSRSVRSLRLASAETFLTVSSTLVKCWNRRRGVKKRKVSAT